MARAGDDAISISSEEPQDERRAILEPAIRSVVDALGGYEGGVYRLGDECYGCLKDLKKFWRKDDTDDDRTVARIFWETRLLPNDLVPILLETAGRGHLEDKCAIACADLMTAMTWPIDMAEELKELDDEFDKGADYTQLTLSHLNYKAALLRPGVMQALLGISLPCIAKAAKERKERDTQIINVILYLIRNLAFIKDLPQNMHTSADQAEYSSMQTRLIKALFDSNILDLLLTIASNATADAMFNSWNSLVLEIFYLLFRGVKPTSLAMDQSQEPTQNLKRLLAVEDHRKRNFSRNATSRHSRFGTTISVKLNPKKAQAAANAGNEGGGNTQTDPQSSSQAFILHRQQALTAESGSMLDLVKRQRAQKSKKLDELGHDDNLSLDAKLALQNLARTFIESCFNPFLSSLLKDIKAERPKITEKDHLRLLYVTKWFLEFFLCVKAKEGPGGPWDYGLIAEVTERGWIVWVLKRMREAPKLWNELQAGIECLTQLVMIIDGMASSSNPDIADVAEVLQQQIIYNGEVLDIAFESLRMYKERTQSIAYLDSSVHLAYALFRMLEKWGKNRGAGGEMYVRRKAKSRRKKRGKDDEHGVPDVEEEEQKGDDDDVVHETMFTFDMFQMRFAHTEITQALLVYVARYKEFTSAEQMKRVVGLLHRQAVKAKAEGLFFNVSTLDLFKNILSDEKSFPKDRAYTDLVALIKFILRQFFKAVEEDSFLAVEAFFPKNRGNWKHFSSWAPEEKTSKDGRMADDTRFPPDVQVKKGYSWSEQLGIAMACLMDEGKKILVDWTKQILAFAISQRQRIIEDTDGSTSQVNAMSDEDADDGAEIVVASRGPSSEALAKINDYLIPYVSDEEANAATKDPHLKLLFRLVKFYVLDESADELEWYIPAAILPSDLQSSLNVINQFLETPLDLQDKKASSLLSKKRRRRRRRRLHAPNPAGAESSEDEAPRKKKQKKKKEKQQYKSAQFIEDSDVEYGDMEAFLEKEKALRVKTALAAATTGQSGTMKATGTKKRRKKATDDGKAKKRRKRGKAEAVAEEKEESDDNQSDESDLNLFDSPRQSPAPAENSSDAPGETQSKARPRPRPKFRGKITSPSASMDGEGSRDEPEQSRDSIPPHDEPHVESSELSAQEPGDESDASLSVVARKGKKKSRLQLSFSDEED
ncbi:uncharacterized protein FIBRA_07712 [Fibroporia radiculosa]|uniref:Timeless N-terminal domain-containing protein n=1 Tax=Fibroporia radiculosa TaxID=599839 RepID=J4IBY9_9APHY|nr:uncharacterized protein FIBRA_07712 [Fibroporia radiculosa]CCM05491.1 predicted protein [Fibroporia radiculosa]